MFLFLHLYTCIFHTEYRKYYLVLSLIVSAQAGMPALGTVRQVTEKNMSVEPVDTTTVSLQMGTNKVPTQSGLTPMGGSRLVYDRKYCNQRGSIEA